jgi:hypothetical protein
MKLEESTFLFYASKYYDNQQCHDILEFEEDLKRFHYLRKLFGRYKQLGDLKERLILNHLIIIYNCFGIHATNMLFMKLEDYHEYLKPFVAYLNYMPEFIEYNNKKIHKSQIKDNLYISQVIDKI